MPVLCFGLTHTTGGIPPVVRILSRPASICQLEFRRTGKKSCPEEGCSVVQRKTAAGKTAAKTDTVSDFATVEGSPPLLLPEVWTPKAKTRHKTHDVAYSQLALLLQAYDVEATLPSCDAAGPTSQLDITTRTLAANYRITSPFESTRPTANHLFETYDVFFHFAHELVAKQLQQFLSTASIEFHSLKERKDFATRLNTLLRQIGYRIKCWKCGEPAGIRAVPTLLQPKGVFQARHTTGKKSTHQATSDLPLCELIPYET